GALNPWSYTINYPTATWEDGEKYLVVSRATDKAGNVESVFTVGIDSNTFTYDTTQPEVAVTTPSTHVNYDPVIYGTSMDYSPGVVSEVRVQIRRQDDVYWAGSDWGDIGVKYWVLADGTVNWSYSGVKDAAAWGDEIEYSVWAKARDDAGNWSEISSSQTFIVDKSSPYSGVTVPVADGYYRTFSPNKLTGTANDKDGMGDSSVSDVTSKNQIEIQIKDEDTGKYWRGIVLQWGAEKWLPVSNYTPGYPGTWEYTGLLSDDGTWTSGHRYRIKTRASDNAGNKEVPDAGVTFIFDNTNATSTVNVPVDGASYSSLSSITGSASDDASGIHPAGVKKVEVRIKNESTGQYLTAPDTWGGEVWNVATGTTSWTLNATAWTSSTTYTINCRAYDNVGYPSENIEVNFSTFTFTFDDTPPSSEITSPAPNLYSSNLTTISGTVWDLTTGVNGVKVAIKGKTGWETDRFWNGSTWTSVGTWAWLDASGSLPSNPNVTVNWNWTTSTTTWTSGNRYELFSKGKDRTDYTPNEESPDASGIIFTFDNVKPVSVTTYPVQGVGYSDLPEVYGTASDSDSGVYPAGIKNVLISIQIDPNGSPPGNWWDGDGWDSASEVWFTASYSGGNWSYNTSTITWLSAKEYRIRTKSSDNASPSNVEVEPLNYVDFTIDNVAPVSYFIKPSSGASYNNSDNKLTTLYGTAEDDASGVLKVEIAIQDFSVGKYYDGSAFNSDTPVWLLTSSTSTGLTADWSYPAPPWTSGHYYRAYVKATDKTQVPEPNVETEHYVQFSIDIKPPTVVVKDPQNGVFRREVNSISGTADDDFSGVDTIMLRILEVNTTSQWNGVAFVGTGEYWLSVSTSNPGLPDWQYTGITNSDWTSGYTYKLIPSGTDKAQNEVVNYSTSTFYYDSIAPTSTVVSPQNNTYYRASVLNSLEGTSEDKPTGAGLVNAGLSQVHIQLYDVNEDKYWTDSGWSSTTVQWLLTTGTTDWSYSFNPANWATGHKYLITPRGTDAIGNVETVLSTATFYIDSDDPTSVITIPAQNANVAQLDEIDGTSIDYPQGGGLYNSGVSNIKVQIYDLTTGSTGYWNGNTWQQGEIWLDAGGTGSWYWTVVYSTMWENGHTYRIKSKATDDAGNIETPSAGTVFNFDTEAPQSAVTSPADGEYVKYLDTVSGTSSDNLSGVKTVYVSIKRNSDGYYYNKNTEVFENTGGTPIWNDIGTAASPWSFSVSTGVWENGITYTIQSKAEDNVTSPSSNMEVPVSSNTFTFDTSIPVSGVSVPENNGAYTGRPVISGTASDASPGVLTQIEFRLWREAGPDYWWSDVNGWQADEVWNVATTTGDWTTWSSTYTEKWVLEAEYRINSKATDSAGNIELNFTTNTFRIDRSSPTSGITTPSQGQFYQETDISGTSDDTGPGNSASGVSVVQVQVKKFKAGSTYYWSNYSHFDTTVENWEDATGLANWSFTNITAQYWESGYMYEAKSRAKDWATNQELNLPSVFFYIDKDAPTSGIEAPVDNNYYNTLTEIEGTCVDEPTTLYNSGVNVVEIRIYDENNPTEPYWDAT
ncbi:hypothetical protein DRQ17_06410, partial [bacterium]